ncbi:hypothetical protein PHYBOEH_005839 [Phytophthora boehmeriae]|uniref:FYVE-type domain-containing protein n=1 Tax=Phytophthora boehmeriae TaxID=109152 RepID=A0A8T1WLP4_9STRA|nr:hypothetical protein PHYBOEH_005839 [Phytophthora boehmeriae]
MARGAPSSSRVAAPAADPQASQRTWTPLREDYFQPPLLSSRERQYLVRKSCEAAQELVERARSAGGPISWRHVEKSNGVQVYAGAPRSGAAGAALSAASMCGVTCVPGTVKEVASLFQLGSSRSMKEFARAHREWFYDGVVLHTLAPRTKEKPLHQVTAKWMVVQTPHGLPHRDFCYLECQDKFIDARGRKGWVLGQHSIKLPGCDELKKEFGLVRGSLYHSGFVVVESEERPGHVDVIHLVQINFKEHTPVPASFLRARVVFVAQVRNMLRSKRLNEQRYLSDLELVPRKYRARCSVCQDSFSLLLLRKLNCRKCGEVVCAACSKEFPIENRNFAATNGGEEVRKLRICMHCFQVITNAPKPTSALAEPPHSSTMSMSFMGYHDDEKHDSPDMCPPLDMSALTSSESTIPISLTSMSNAEMPTPVPTSTPSPIPVSRSRSRGRDREREREVQNELDTVARKYTMVGSTNENEEEDLVDHEHRDSEEAESDGDSFAQRDSELLLNTAGCDMNYLDADMRQFHDQSLFMRPNRSGDAPTFHGDRSFSSQLKDNMSALPVTASNEALLAPANKVINQESHVATPPYEHLPTSPKHKSEKSLDSAPRTTRPTIHRDDTFALERMDLEERQVSRTAPAGHIVLDAMGDKSSPTAVEMSTIRTDDRFVIANGSMVSAPVEGDAESLTFHEGQPNNELTPPVVPISVSSSSQEAEGDIVQTSGDELSEVRSRASSRMSFSSAPSARSSSVCSSRLDLASPPATPPTSSPAPISRLSATSASSPVAVASALELAASNDAFTLRANGSPEVTPASNHNTNSAPPAYVPDRFRKMEQSHEMQFTPKQAAALPSSKTPRQSGDSGAALDNFQLDFSASFSTNQDRSASGGNDLVVEGITRLPPPEERNRAGSTGSNDVRVRYQPFGSSVLDTVPDSDVLSTSASEDEDDSEDENMLLSARQLYERFGNTSKLSQMAGGNRPGFQRTLSQIQQSFDQLSDSESEDDTRVSTVAARRR